MNKNTIKMNMNLQEMIEAQRELDERIIKEQSLEGKNLVKNTFVALQVELAEMANEHQWFKHWKDNPKPNTSKMEFFFLNGKDGHKQGHELIDPLLEEYVDALHFFLSIAIQNNWENALFVHQEQLSEDGKRDLTHTYLELTFLINISMGFDFDEETKEWHRNAVGFEADEYHFRLAWLTFLNLGLYGFNFTLDEIGEAYFKKNKTNHERQDEGY